MDRDLGKSFDVRWVAQCARRLRQRWPHAELTSLEEAAVELWGNEALRALPAAEAAERWLSPLSRPEPARRKDEGPGVSAGPFDLPMVGPE